MHQKNKVYYLYTLDIHLYIRIQSSWSGNYYNLKKVKYFPNDMYKQAHSVFSKTKF